MSLSCGSTSDKGIGKSSTTFNVEKATNLIENVKNYIWKQC